MAGPPPENREMLHCKLTFNFVRELTFNFVGYKIILEISFLYT